MLLNMSNQEKRSQCPFISSKNEDIHSLSERINISTRVTHTQLNRLIIARLPLALPPHNLTPSAYISGILHIAPIYINFESLWQRIIGRPKYQAKGYDQIHSTLVHLRLPDVLRTGRLRGDIKTLSGCSEQEVDEQLLKICQNGKLSDFIAHTTNSVNAKPHVLLAYVWVMYMALFSGGRYIRASLQDAGAEFWSNLPSAVPSCPHSRSLLYRSLNEWGKSEEQIPLPQKDPKSERQSPAVNQGLQFFHFLGEEDGEDIKTELKARFAKAEMVLSASEKDDIVQEAQHIFDFMVEMVGELDRVCGLADQKNAPVATMKGRGGVCIGREALARKQDSRAGEHDHVQLPSSFIFAKVGSLIANRQKSTTVRADIAFVLFVLFLVLFFVVW